MRYKLAKIVLMVGVLATVAGCIKNDIPYPVIVADITAFQVQGQVGDAVIDKANRTVTVELAETEDLSQVKVTKLSVTPEGEVSMSPSLAIGDLLDLREKKNVTLRTYQDYVWTLIGHQTIKRELRVENQVGDPLYNEEEHAVLVYVSKEATLNNMSISTMKLGPEGSTITPAISTVKNFTRPVKFVVSYKGVDTEWTVVILRSVSNVDTGASNPWATFSFLQGSFVVGSSVTPTFEYKPETGANWTQVPTSAVTIQGGVFSAKVTGLTPATTYLYRAVLDQELGITKTFTTEPATQILNMGFDEWIQVGKSWYPNRDLEAANFWWDSGNEGANTLSAKNPTSPEEVVLAVAGEGKRAAKLQSMAVVGVFAAGSLYLGDYGRTLGTSGAELIFGRPYTSRPTRMTGYYNYAPGTIDKAKDPYKALLGEPDTCHIYVILTDWDEPFVVNNRDKIFIDLKGDPKIIAYGELKSGDNSGGYQPFNISLEYRYINRQPKFAVIVGSSSKYGDYFTGSTTSLLYLDEFEFHFD